MSQELNKSGRIRKILYGFLLAAAGLSLGLGINYYRLHKERGIHRAEMARAEGQIGLLQRKFQEAQSRSDSLLRARYLLEGETKKLRQELEQVKGELAELEKTGTGRIKTLEAEVAGLMKKLAVSEERGEALRAKLRETDAALQTATAELTQTTRERDQLRAELALTSRNLKRCGEYNGELHRTAMEILDRYQDQNFLADLIKKEQFTGLMRIELEHQAQEYAEWIEKNRFAAPGF
ncbi:MAG: hypothetical protein JXB25_03685 [Deltaproteobacteria bacterium]|nr:hypothetical protein [Deltaproteobacteria bacterium]